MTVNNQKTPQRIFDSPHSPIPEVQLLSNGRYHVMVTSAGGGDSRWSSLAVTRWCEDAVCDNWGTFCYIRDAASGDSWSTAYQPTLQQADVYEAVFSPQQILSKDLAGEPILSILSHAPGNDAPIGGLKVITENGWFAARPSGTEDIYKIYVESFRGEQHLRRIADEAQAIVDKASAVDAPTGDDGVP